MEAWTKQVLELREGHGWKAKPGFKIFVADRGALRFDLPQEWVLVPSRNSIKFHDRQPPEDNCVLEVSLVRLPPVDWTGLPLPQLIRQVLKDEQTGSVREEDVHKCERPGLEFVWTETVFIDPTERREARSRVGLARGTNKHALITLAYWPEDAARISPMWDELVSSLEFDVLVKDPTQGPVVM